MQGPSKREIEPIEEGPDPSKREIESIEGGPDPSKREIVPIEGGPDPSKREIESIEGGSLERIAKALSVSPAWLACSAVNEVPFSPLKVG